MHEERRLMNTGMPIEDAIMVCFAMRRSGGLEEFVRQEEEKVQSKAPPEKNHACTCGGNCKCEDCPNKRY